MAGLVVHQRPRMGFRGQSWHGFQVPHLVRGAALVDMGFRGQGKQARWALVRERAGWPAR